jgi:hypothetical protein
MPGQDPTAAAIAAADAAVAAAEASAAEGEANAKLAYTLSNQILQDDQFAAIIPLDLLVAKVIAAGLQAYVQVSAKEAAAMQQAQAAMTAANQQAASLFKQYDDQFKSILGGKGNG